MKKILSILCMSVVALMAMAVPTAKQPTCAGETIMLHADGFATGMKYDDYFEDWSCSVIAEGYTFRFDWYAPANKGYGTFTTPKFEMYFSYGTKPDGTRFDYDAITMTIQQQVVSQKLTQTLLNATIQGSDGNTYILSMVENILTADETITHTLQDAHITTTSSSLVLQGRTEQLDVLLTVNTDWPIGTFESGHIDLANSSVSYAGVAQELQQPKLVVATKQVEGQMMWDAMLTFCNQDTVFHEVNVLTAMAAPADTVTINCKNLEVDDEWSATFGTVYLFGSDAYYDISVVYYGNKMQAGTYSDIMLYITDKATKQTVRTLYQSLRVEKDTRIGWVAKVEALGVDNQWYSVEMSYQLPVAKDTVSIRFEQSAVASFWSESNDLQLENENDAYEVAVDIKGVKPGERFGMDKVDMYYTSIRAKGAGYPIDIADVAGELWQNGDTTMISAEVLGFDSVMYDIAIWHTVPAVVDTVRLDMQVRFDNALEMGYYTLTGFAADSAYMVNLTPFTTQVAGEYMNDGLFGRLGADGGQYDFYFAQTYIVSVRDWAAEDYTLHTIEKGSLSVQMAEDGVITALAKMIASDGVYYEISMTSKYRDTMWDQPKEPVNRTYGPADDMTLENNAKDYGFIDFYVIAEDGSDLFELYFYTHSTDPDIVIPEGTYPINYTGKEGTVRATSGAEDGYVYPSFYAQIDGEYLNNVYFFDSGSVEVSKNSAGKLHIEVNAVDIYDNTVRIVYDASNTGSGVEHVQNASSVAHGQKILRKGQLLIQRNDKTYNVHGMQIKY